MANEVVILEKYGSNNDGGLRRRTVASNAAIPYGTILKLTDPNTAAIMDAAAQAFAGISAMEKKNDDYSETITVFTDVVADIVASGAVTLGAWVTGSSTGSLNYVSSALVKDSASGAMVASGAALIGYIEETASDNERVRVRIRH